MKIAVLSHDKETLDKMSGFLATENDLIELALSHGEMERAEALVEQEGPDVLILEGPCSSPSELSALERITPVYPGMTVIVICRQQSPEFLLQAMRIGVREVLPAPVSQDALREAIGRIRQRITWAAAPKRKGRVLAFVPCKGGSGSTFLATNLAYMLAAVEHKSVALLDLNLHFGDASLFVSDVHPASTLSDVARQIQRLDAAFLAASMIEVLPNYGILAAPEAPEMVLDIRPEVIERLLKVAVNHYDYVILDIGRILDANSVKALDYADVVYPVLQLTLPFIRDAKRLLGVFHSLGYTKDKIELVVNRYEKGGEISLADVEQTLGLKVHATVSNSFASVAASINQGIPIYRLAPRDPVTKELQEMGQKLAKAGRSGGNWLKNLLSMKA